MRTSAFGQNLLQRVFQTKSMRESTENLSIVPDTTNVSYSTNVSSHYDSEDLEKFPESSRREAGKDIVKDIRGGLELES